MTKGVAFWSDRSRFWVQTKNGVEAILKAALPKGPDGKVHGWLETCGPTAVVNILDAMGKPITNQSPTKASIRPMDFLTLWMNTPINWPALSAVVPGLNPETLLENEVAQFYPLAVKTVFGAECSYFVGPSWDWLTTVVFQGAGALICRVDPVTKAGHFLAVVAYDDVAKCLIYNDSWPGRTGTPGFNLGMDKTEWSATVRPYVVVFS